MTGAQKAPEVLQISAMDCGPAALHAVALGFGLATDISDLRERCHTDVDGTSIDELERLALELGLHAEQRLLPADMALADASLFPAIAVVRLESGEPHFIVAWRRTRAGVAVMDPAIGAYTMSLGDFAARLWRHELRIDRIDWQDYVATPEFAGPMVRRLVTTGFSAARARARVNAATGAGTAATLDAAARHVADLIKRRVARTKTEARLLLDAFVAAPHSLPADTWMARVEVDLDKARLAGAVFLSFSGTSSAASRRKTKRSVAWRWGSLGLIGTLLGANGYLAALLLVLMTAVTTAAGFAELLLLRAAMDVGNALNAGQQQAFAVLALVVVLAGGYLLRQGLSSEGMRLGHRLEIELRSALLERLPRIPDSYFETRSSADLAERAHAIQIVRMAPGQILHLLHAIMEPVGLVLCLSLLDGGAFLPSVAALCLTLVFSVGSFKRLGAAERRQRGLSAALSSTLLESLVGLLPLRLHRAEAAYMARFDRQLSDWATGARSMARQTRLIGLGADLAILVATAAVILLHFGFGGDGAATDLLFVYWALRLPVAAGTLASLSTGLASQVNAIDRLVEPLAAAGESGDPLPDCEVPIGVHISGRASRGGQAVLEGLDLHIAPGEHVAIVGRSGAGKSSLLGLLLGFHELDGGRIEIDGEALTPERIPGLRAVTAWLDPSNRLFDDTLAENAAVSLPPGHSCPLPGFLDDLVSALPDREHTRLGEAGLLLSGGEAQRVRIARAMAHPATRLVLCDEPFNGLDRAERRAMMATIRSHWAKTTLLCVTHDIADTTGFDRVVVLDAGRIAEDDQPARLLARPSVYGSLLAVEEEAEQELWGLGWRHLHLDHGRLHDHA
jgi:ABC-type bacteriocin/lantibiotic exporter with double-glycine peptidase domain